MFKGFLPTRVTLAILCATGVMEIYMTRINLSIAIVAMVQTVLANATDDTAPMEPYCLREHGIGDPREEERSVRNLSSIRSHGDEQSPSLWENPEIESSRLFMTSAQRGNILSAFFYAYGITGIFGGRLADRFGTKFVFGAAVLADGIGNALLPLAARTNVMLLFATRFVIGLFQGLCYPSLHSLVAKWIPAPEISRFLGFVYFANSFGMILALSLFGYVISALGWEAVFYLNSAFSFVWLLTWMGCMVDSPEDHPRISTEELSLILEDRGSSKKEAVKMPVPWKSMILSLPLWAIHVAHAGSMFGLSFVMTQLPLYLSSIIGINIKNNGVLSSLPFLARCLGSNFSSWISSFLMKKVNLHAKTWQIIFTILGFGGPAISILLVGYAKCNANAALVFFILGMAFNGVTSCGYLCNHLMIAPKLAGTTMGISSMVGFFYAMTGPALAGWLTPEETREEWVTLYWIVAASYAITGLFYCVFVSTKEQPWNNYQTESKLTVTGSRSEYGDVIPNNSDAAGATLTFVVAPSQPQSDTDHGDRLERT